MILLLIIFKALWETYNTSPTHTHLLFLFPRRISKKTSYHGNLWGKEIRGREGWRESPTNIYILYCFNFFLKRNTTHTDLKIIIIIMYWGQGHAKSAFSYTSNRSIFYLTFTGSNTAKCIRTLSNFPFKNLS